MATLQSFFDSLVRRILGASVVTVHDASNLTAQSGGAQVPAEILRATAPSYLLDEEGSQKLERLASVFATSSDFASKWQMGRNTGTTAFYDDCVVSHLGFGSFIVTMMGAADANVGAFDAYSGEIQKSLAALMSS